ncbi:hypothetical protein QBC39DRAFT_354435 [Podospora conica]|nr:hypothetical protein QBC39DRAFT_354435 [Schizothecium conicum]
MSAFGTLKTTRQGSLRGAPCVSGHHPMSFASRMAQMAVDQEREKVTWSTPPKVRRQAAKSGDNEASVESKFNVRVGDKGSRFAASSDVAGRSKGGRKECHLDLSGHHPLSFAPRKTMMGTNEKDIPNSLAQEDIIPGPAPSIALPQRVLVPNVDGVSQRQQQVDEIVNFELDRPFKKPAPLRLPASVVLAGSHSFTGSVSDVRAVVKLVEFPDLPDSIGFVAEFCDVSDDDETNNDIQATKSDTNLRVHRSGLRRASNGKPARPSSETRARVRGGYCARATDSRNGRMAGGWAGAEQRVEFGVIPMVFVVEAGSELAMGSSKDGNEEVETMEVPIQLEMRDSSTRPRSASANGRMEN